MLTQVDCDSTAAVSDFVRAVFSSMYPGASGAWLQKLFADVDSLFAGRMAPYAPIDVRYHDLRHTLMATVCMTELLEGRRTADGGEMLKERDFELAIAGVLLHDTGYLKLTSDKAGTGAKYTFCHILRSCAFTAAYLPHLGATDLEIEHVLSAINCTGPGSEVGRLVFRSHVSRLVGCALATADYLGQLSDPRYPQKLGELYREFCESDDFVNVPQERRAFKSEEDLVCRTPGFWTHFVKPKLDNDFQAVYRYLARPPLSDANDYIAAVEANFVIINERAQAIRARAK